MIIIIHKNKDKITDFTGRNYSPFLVLSLLFLSVIFQLIAIQLFNVNPRWDFEVIFNQSKNIALYGEFEGDYLLRYQNNLFITFLLALISKIFTSELFILQYFNVFIITISQYLIYRIVSKIAGKSIGVISLIISVVFFPYIFYAPIVYTDTISLIFLLLPLNILVDKSGNFKSDIITILIVSVLYALGTLLKGTLIIFSIALSIVFLLFLKKWRKLLLILPLIVVILTKIVFDTLAFSTDLIDKEAADKLKFPVTHWIMMGQNSKNNGLYSGEDVTFTYELLQKYSPEKVSKFHMEELNNRLRNRGLIGSIQYNFEKIKHTWTDGTYYALNKLKRHPEQPNNISRLTTGVLGNIVQGLAKIQHLFILIGVLFFAKKFKNENNAIFTFGMLSIIGFFLFFIIWETRSRYIVSLTPILIILCCLGYFGRKKQKIYH